uniref:Uncharacterized protein n=1 Tax=Salix viminalis TaxID=40686 RepID=A0A6N2KUY6_SALVM
MAAAHEQMRSAEEDAAEWKWKYDIAVRETKASFEKDFQEMQEMLQQLKFEKEKTEVLLKEKDEMLKAKDDEIEMKGKEQEKMKSEFQKLEIERLAQIERAQRHVESLYSDWDLLPPKTIKDPEAKKPEIWDDKEYIPDPEDKKPEDWDDEEDASQTSRVNLHDLQISGLEPQISCSSGLFMVEVVARDSSSLSPVFSKHPWRPDISAKAALPSQTYNILLAVTHDAYGPHIISIGLLHQ